jgi:ribonuclease P protein component
MSPGAFSVSVLRNRPDFLKAAQARRAHMPAFLLQARERREGEAEGIRVGFTCSKKVGNAVARNRAKRRLREIARLVLPLEGRPGWDYVLVGRKDETASRDFTPDAGRSLPRPEEGPRMSPLAYVVSLPVRFYRAVLSPWLGHSCRYPADLLGLRAGGAGKTWRDQGHVADAAPDRAMPSVGRFGDRQRSRLTGRISGARR